jgi:hypothetical protein
MACLARAAIHAGKKRIEEFVQIGKSGVAEIKENQAAAYFSKWMRDHSQLRAGGHMQRVELYKSTQSAIKAFIERREIKTLRPTDQDLFPLDEVVE